MERSKLSMMTFKDTFAKYWFYLNLTCQKKRFDMFEKEKFLSFSIANT